MGAGRGLSVLRKETGTKQELNGIWSLAATQAECGNEKSVLCRGPLGKSTCSIEARCGVGCSPRSGK